MSLKWKEISILVEEAKPLLTGSVVQKIAQIREIAQGESFFLQGFGEYGPWRLWICLQHDHTCWALAEKEWQLDAQPSPSVFVMVLRKHLQGQRIVSLEQLPGERILTLTFANQMVLLFELLPKKANLILLEHWDSQERKGKFLQSFRQVSLQTGGIYELPPVPEMAISEEVREFPGEGSFHARVGSHYWQLVQQSGFESFRRAWRQAWKNHRKKISTAVNNARKDLEAAQEAERYQKWGKALWAKLYELGAQKMPSEKNIEIDGLKITLDLSKSFSENAEIFFKKSKKFHRAIQELETRLAELENRLAELDIVSEKIEKAETDADLQALEADFIAEGLPLPQVRSKGAKKVVHEAKPFLEVQSSDGFLILCGRNQTENRRVTFKEAKGNDIWLHVKGVPGSHVVVKGQKNKTVPLSTLLEAAQLCLYHSKIRRGKRAEVDYTQKKYVRSIKGTLAEVTYTGNKTLYIEADPEAIKKIMRV